MLMEQATRTSNPSSNSIVSVSVSTFSNYTKNYDSARSQPVVISAADAIKKTMEKETAPVVAAVAASSSKSLKSAPPPPPPPPLVEETKNLATANPTTNSDSDSMKAPALSLQQPPSSSTSKSETHSIKSTIRLSLWLKKECILTPLTRKDLACSSSLEKIGIPAHSLLHLANTHLFNLGVKRVGWNILEGILKKMFLGLGKGDGNEWLAKNFIQKNPDDDSMFLLFVCACVLLST